MRKDTKQLSFSALDKNPPPGDNRGEEAPGKAAQPERRPHYARARCLSRLALIKGYLRSIRALEVVTTVDAVESALDELYGAYCALEEQRPSCYPEDDPWHDQDFDEADPADDDDL